MKPDGLTNKSGYSTDMDVISMIAEPNYSCNEMNTVRRRSYLNKIAVTYITNNRTQQLISSYIARLVSHDLNCKSNGSVEVKCASTPPSERL